MERLAHSDRFANLVPALQITEFDVGADGDEELAADFTRNALITTSSHPAYTGFVFWGFWEGAHWKPETARWRKGRVVAGEIKQVSPALALPVSRSSRPRLEGKLLHKPVECLLPLCGIVVVPGDVPHVRHAFVCQPGVNALTDADEPVFASARKPQKF